jgi:hypothetical protein
VVSLACTGHGRLKIELARNGTALQGWAGIACGETKLLDVVPGEAYLAEVLILPGGTSLEYVHYTLRIESMG